MRPAVADGGPGYSFVKMNMIPVKLYLDYIIEVYGEVDEWDRPLHPITTPRPKPSRFNFGLG